MNRILAAIVIQAAVLAASGQSPKTPLPQERQLFELLNAARERDGLEKLDWNANLATAARAHAEQMARQGELSHLLPGELPLQQRVGSTGERFDAVAENVAVADNIDDAHFGLMTSPGHRANILTTKYNAVGVAVVQAGKRVYVAQDFARVLPAYSPEEFREEVVAAFNRARKAHGFGPVGSEPDRRLDDQACAGKLEPEAVLLGTNGAMQATVFSATQPANLPPPMEKAAADPNVRRMNIGVCFRPDADKFSRFWVVAAFFASR
ncbi:MAG TPA: CAP domain-containing protein [Candidatus Angelobacter sp.]|nr:CAP domain-containing protein [Candidatus Angelobacter sp.]